MNKQKFGVRLWLWCVLASVIVIGLAFTFWYSYQVKSIKTSTVTSPIPTKSTTISPTASGSAKTTPSPSAEQTSTPNGDQTVTPVPTPTPTTNPPAGWKETTGTAVGAGPAEVKFSVFIKDGWKKYNEYDVLHGPVFFTGNSNCQAWDVYSNCWDDLAVTYYESSTSNHSNMNWRSYDAIGKYNNTKVYVGVNKSFSEDEQNIIFNSFKVTLAY